MTYKTFALWDAGKFPKEYIVPNCVHFLYRMSINDCLVKPALEKILLCRFFETDADIDVLSVLFS
jgi:hypothetical protein